MNWLDSLLLRWLFQPLVNRVGVAPIEVSRFFMLGAIVCTAVLGRVALDPLRIKGVLLFAALVAAEAAVYAGMRHLGRTPFWRLYATVILSYATNLFTRDALFGDVNGLLGILLSLSLWSAIYIGGCTPLLVRNGKRFFGRPDPH